MAQRRRLPSVLGEHWLETEDLKVIQPCSDVLLEQVTSMPPLAVPKCVLWTGLATHGKSQSGKVGYHWK